MKHPKKIGLRAWHPTMRQIEELRARGDERALVAVDAALSRGKKRGLQRYLDYVVGRPETKHPRSLTRRYDLYVLDSWGDDDGGGWHINNQRRLATVRLPWRPEAPFVLKLLKSLGYVGKSVLVHEIALEDFDTSIDVIDAATGEPLFFFVYLDDGVLPAWRPSRSRQRRRPSKLPQLPRYRRSR